MRCAFLAKSARPVTAFLVREKFPESTRLSIERGWDSYPVMGKCQGKALGDPIRMQIAHDLSGIEVSLPPVPFLGFKRWKECDGLPFRPFLVPFHGSRNEMALHTAGEPWLDSCSACLVCWC